MDMHEFSGYPGQQLRLYRFVQRKIAGRIVGGILWLVFWVVSCTLWGRTSAYMSPLGWTMLGVLIGLLAWPVFGLGKILSDKPFEGRISALKLAYIWHSDSPWSRSGIRKEPLVTAYITLDDGREIKFKFPVKDIHPKDYYAVGDRVRHYRGLPYPEKKEKPEDVVICVSCGKFSLIGDECCEYCRLPLLK